VVKYLLVLSRVILILALLSCGDFSGGNERPLPTRSVSPSGYTVVSLLDVPSGPEFFLDNPVRIGADDSVTFSSISDIEVSTSGEIVVMDYRASELRRFHPSGPELPLLAGPGAGPGEIGRAMGIAVQRNGTVWVNDFGNARYSWFPPDDAPGSILAQSVRMRGLVDGGVTEDGQPWVRMNQRVGESSSIKGGLIKATMATYFVRIDIGRSHGADSIFLGSSSLLTADLPRRQGSRRVQYTNERHVAFDPGGAVWTAESDGFKLVRLSLTGDTTLVINVETPNLQLPEELRRRELTTLEEWFASVRADVPSLEESIPKIYPLIDRLAVDQQGRVWVQRRGERGTVFECFTANGNFAGRYHVTASPWVWGNPAVGDDLLVVIAVDSLDVQSLLAWRVPQ